MKRNKRSAQALLLAITLLASLLASSGVASAASVYDNMVRQGGFLVDNGNCAGDATSLWISAINNPSSWVDFTNQPTIAGHFSTALSNETGWAVIQREAKANHDVGSASFVAGDRYLTVLISANSSTALNFTTTVDYGKVLLPTTSVDVVQMAWIGGSGSQPCELKVIGSGVSQSLWYSPFAMEDSSAYVFNSLVKYNQVFANFTINYPPGYEGGLIPTEPPPAKYVGMGDSYSSGLGSRRPYMDGTDTATNKCRRSLAAYPMLLSADTSLNLGPTSFVACGGATASAVTTGGFNSESAQMDALTSETRLVTITITGNDMPFDVFARECATPGLDQGCVLTGQAYLNAMASIDANVKPRLEQLLQTLDDRLTALGSDARVLVIGYAHLLPKSWVYETGCWWLQPNEHPAIRSVTDTLNATIREKVVAKGGRFEFVSATDSTSPFIGHELCREVGTSSNYFNSVVLGENEADSFHPNEAGHREGYARLVKDYLILHP